MLSEPTRQCIAKQDVSELALAIQGPCLSLPGLLICLPPFKRVPCEAIHPALHVMSIRGHVDDASMIR